MKVKFLVLLVLVISMLASTSCKRYNSGNVNVVEKPNSETQNQGNGSNTPNSGLNNNDEEYEPGTEEYFKNIIDDRAREAITALKNYDMEKLSELVHPDKGVRFTPYGYIEVDRDILFSSDKIRNIGKDNTKYVWGYYDGIGDPIELTFSDYYKRFIYDADFINAEEIGYNRVIGTGNSINNSLEVYKDAIIVEYHFPGIDPKYEGFDWRSLRIAFEKMNDSWYIVGIIHDEWTI